MLYVLCALCALYVPCRYADESGTTLLGPSGQTNVAIAEFIGSGDLLGLEEMHIFFEIAWFDKGSWAWGQYLAEWGTRGIFQVRQPQTRRGSGWVRGPRINTSRLKDALWRSMYFAKNKLLDICRRNRGGSTSKNTDLYMRYLYQFM